MFSGIILSKDRAAQLDLCLSSIKENSRGIFDDLKVVYLPSNDDFENGYKLLKDLHSDVEFIKQSNFKEDTAKALQLCKNKNITFFTDDDIFYRKLSDNEALDVTQVFEALSNMCCFSLRLGLNTYIQDPYNNSTTIPPSNGFTRWSEMILWSWRECPPYMNFGYPLSVDGHIFSIDTWEAIWKGYNFNNPNQLEVAMQAYNDKLPTAMVAFAKSCVVNTPLNRVQETCLNRSGEKFGHSAKDLNDKFLQGNYLDLDRIDFSNIVGCHQELEIQWAMM